jgi:hypothetical protein
LSLLSKSEITVCFNMFWAFSAGFNSGDFAGEKFGCHWHLHGSQFAIISLRCVYSSPVSFRRQLISVTSVERARSRVFEEARIGLVCELWDLWDFVKKYFCNKRLFDNFQMRWVWTVKIAPIDFPGLLWYFQEAMEVFHPNNLGNNVYAMHTPLLQQSALSPLSSRSTRLLSSPHQSPLSVYHCLSLVCSTSPKRKTHSNFQRLISFGHQTASAIETAYSSSEQLYRSFKLKAWDKTLFRSF